MPSKRKLSLKSKATAKANMAKPGGASKYALKRRRMAAGWDNPRSPIRLTETQG